MFIALVVLAHIYVDLIVSATNVLVVFLSTINKHFLLLLLLFCKCFIGGYKCLLSCYRCSLSGYMCIIGGYKCAISGYKCFIGVL